MYGTPARLRVEQQAARRTNGAVVISTLLSLLVVAAAVAMVAYLVLRSPSSAVDSAERLEPVGTALPAPTEPPALPTPIPTAPPEPTALGFTGEVPAVAGLPTVAPPREAGPTPTPRIVNLPLAAPPRVAPPTAVPPPPTLPPSLPVAQAPVPVVALQPVESAPAPVSTAQAVPAQAQGHADGEPTPAPVVLDDDPFNIFSEDGGSGIVPAQNDALARARALQGGSSLDEDDDQGSVDPVAPAIDIPEVVLDEGDIPVVTGRDGTVEIVMPDVDAMIEEITSRATDPARNPNVTGAGTSANDRGTTSGNNRRKSARDRINERRGRRTTVPISSSVPNTGIPVNEPNQNQGECEDPFANLPADMRPDNFPFSDC